MFDSSTGFPLPEGSVLSPDLVIELASPSDEGPRGTAALSWATHATMRGNPCSSAGVAMKRVR